MNGLVSYLTAAQPDLDKLQSVLSDRLRRDVLISMQYKATESLENRFVHVETRLSLLRIDTEQIKQERQTQEDAMKQWQISLKALEGMIST